MSHRRASKRADDGDAFIRDPEGGPILVDGSVDQEMVEDFLRSATSGEDAGEDIRNQELPEDDGGPFLTTAAGTELADDVDDSNPVDAKREPVPSPMRGA